MASDSGLSAGPREIRGGQAGSLECSDGELKLPGRAPAASPYPCRGET